MFFLQATVKRRGEKSLRFYIYIRCWKTARTWKSIVGEQSVLVMFLVLLVLPDLWTAWSEHYVSLSSPGNDSVSTRTRTINARCKNPPQEKTSWSALLPDWLSTVGTSRDSRRRRRSEKAKLRSVCALLVERTRCSVFVPLGFRLPGLFRSVQV